MFKMEGAAPQRPSELLEETSWDIICQSVKSQWWPLIPSCQQTEWEKTHQTCEEECRQRCSDFRRLFSTLTKQPTQRNKGNDGSCKPPKHQPQRVCEEHTFTSAWWQQLFQDRRDKGKSQGCSWTGSDKIHPTQNFMLSCDWNRDKSVLRWNKYPVTDLFSCVFNNISYSQYQNQFFKSQHGNCHKNRFFFMFLLQGWSVVEEIEGNGSSFFQK